MSTDLNINVSFEVYLVVNLVRFAMEICSLGGKIKKNTIQGFYERNITKKNGYISTLDDICLWIYSKNNESLDSNLE